MKFLNHRVYRADRITHRGGGTAIVIKSNIPHHEVIVRNPPPAMETTTVAITYNPRGRLYISSAYNPPEKHIEANSFLNLFHAGHPTIVGGDLNAKNNIWHSKNNNINGKDLMKIASNHSIYVEATTENTYEPTDSGKQKDVLDVFCFKNFTYYYTLSICREMDSDHWPIILNVYNFSYLAIFSHPKTTDWKAFYEFMESKADSSTHLYTDTTSVEAAINSITSDIQQAMTDTSSVRENKTNPFSVQQSILNLIKSRNRARKKWQYSWNNNDKKTYNDLKNKVRREIKSHRDKTWTDLLDSSK